MNKRQQRKPVRSAEAVAALRAASARESDPLVRNPDYLARHFVRGVNRLILALPKSISRTLIEKISPGNYCYILARTRFMDNHLMSAIRRGITQVVILGAGYDSRASRFESQMRDVRVLEVDLAGTQNAKRRRMRTRSIEEPANVTYISHDFNHGTLLSLLQQNGLAMDRPIFFLWEGVSYYLTEPAVADLFHLLTHDCAAGSSVAFDYSLRSFVEGDESTYGGSAIHKWLKKNDERFLFGLNAGELTDYLDSFDLAATEDLGVSDMHRMYLTDQRNRSIGEPFGHLRLAHVARE